MNLINVICFTDSAFIRPLEHAKGLMCSCHAGWIHDPHQAVRGEKEETTCIHL